VKDLHFEDEAADGENDHKEEKKEVREKRNDKKLVKDDNDVKCFRPCWRPVCVEKVPAIFSACHEAMNAVKEKYNPICGNDGSGAVWCNPEEDIVCLRDSGSSIRMDFGNLSNSIRLNIAHLILDCNLVSHLLYCKEEDLRILPGLRTITLATSDHAFKKIVGLKRRSQEALDFNAFLDLQMEKKAFDLIHIFFTRMREQHPDWTAPTVLGDATFIFEPTMVAIRDENRIGWARPWGW
jgi:hypothetical protein